MDAREAHSALEVARMRLAAMWGADGATFDHAEGRLERFATTVPTWKTLQERIKANPDLARWQTERDLHHAELMAERAARIPDLSAAVAYQQYREDDTDALAFGVGMPLPLFDRNQGNIAAATHRIARTEAERSAAALALSTQLREQHTTLVAAHQRATTLGLTVVPAMEQSLEAARLGYQQGKFGFLDMLDAQRGLFEVRADMLDALSAYHIALTEIQRTTGTHLTELWNQE